MFVHFVAFGELFQTSTSVFPPFRLAVIHALALHFINLETT